MPTSLRNKADSECSLATGSITGRMFAGLAFDLSGRARPFNRDLVKVGDLATKASGEYRIVVTPSTDIRRYSVRKTATHSSEPNPTEPIPFGRGGAGLYTGHPVGLVVVVGLLLMGLLALPEARWFLAGAVILGGIWGCFLWLRRR